MKSTSSLFLPLPLTILATAVSSVSAIGWSFSSCSLTSNNIDVTCNGSSSCGLGDTATVSGSTYASSAFDRDSEVTLQVCVASYCPDVASKSGGKVCDWLTATDGQECGEVGTYTVSHEEDIPSSDDVPSTYQWLLSSTATVKVSVDDGCSQSGWSSMSFSMAGMAMLALVGAGVYAKKKSDKDESSDYCKGASFVEMGDNIAIV